MHRRIRVHFGAVLVTAALYASIALARAPVTADTPGAEHLIATTSQARKAPCFFRQEWRGGWKATPDARTIYIRVSGSIYRLDLQSSYSLLKDPFAVLSNKDAANTICTPLDFRLTVSNRAGIEQWPIVKNMTRLTPAEVAALPQKLRP